MASEETTKPPVVILGGPNGAGKTTTATTILPQFLKVFEFVNADLIAAGLSPFRPETAAVEAGRFMLTRIRQLAERRADFAFETTLVSRHFHKLLTDLRGQGYQVFVVYLWLESPDLALARVAERARKGGHHVPEDIVRRRFRRGLWNFFELYRPIADWWTLCDNSQGQLLRVAEGGRDKPTTVIQPERLAEIERMAGHEQP